MRPKLFFPLTIPINTLPLVVLVISIGAPGPPLTGVLAPCSLCDLLIR